MHEPAVHRPMNQIGALTFSLLVAWFICTAIWGRPKRTWFTGFLMKGKDGSIGLTLWTAKKKRRGRRK